MGHNNSYPGEVTYAAYVEKRKRLRRVLSGKETLILPVVYDAVSARIAEIAGFEAALLSGSVAAASLHGFPDLVLVTMTEVAQLAKRITLTAQP